MITRTQIMAALSYLGILCFVPLIYGRGDPFVHFHSRQGLVIWMWGVVALLLLPLPFGRFFFHMSSTAILLLSVAGLVSVLLQKTWSLPFVHGLAEKL